MGRQVARKEEGGESQTRQDPRQAEQIERCPPKAKVTRSNRVGCTSFSLFYNAICIPSLRVQFRFIRASKQLGENFYTCLNWFQFRSTHRLRWKLFGLGRVRGGYREIHNDRFAP
jgi:hypothetical protein